MNGDLAAACLLSRDYFIKINGQMKEGKSKIGIDLQVM
jgi:hypothetical protein